MPEKEPSLEADENTSPVEQAESRPALHEVTEEESYEDNTQEKNDKEAEVTTKQESVNQAESLKENERRSVEVAKGYISEADTTFDSIRSINNRPNNQTSEELATLIHDLEDAMLICQGLDVELKDYADIYSEYRSNIYSAIIENKVARRIIVRQSKYNSRTMSNLNSALSKKRARVYNLIYPINGLMESSIKSLNKDRPLLELHANTVADFTEDEVYFDKNVVDTIQNDPGFFGGLGINRLEISGQWAHQEKGNISSFGLADSFKDIFEATTKYANALVVCANLPNARTIAELTANYLQ